MHHRRIPNDQPETRYDRSRRGRDRLPQVGIGGKGIPPMLDRVTDIRSTAEFWGVFARRLPWPSLYTYTRVIIRVSAGELT